MRAGLTSASPAGTKPLPVNDLTTMVKKKKKAPDANGAEKRKADDESSNSPAEKKARLEDVAEKH